jgi:hypothetical protein
VILAPAGGAGERGDDGILALMPAWIAFPDAGV